MLLGDPTVVAHLIDVPFIEAAQDRGSRLFPAVDGAGGTHLPEVGVRLPLEGLGGVDQLTMMEDRLPGLRFVEDRRIDLTHVR